MTVYKVGVFHDVYLDHAVDKAQTDCPDGYELIDLNVNYLNDRWVVVAKIEKEPESE